MSNKWNKNYMRIGVVFTVSVCICILFAQIIKEWKSIFAVIGLFFSALTPVIIGLVLAFLLNPIMLYFRKGIALIVYKLSGHEKKDKNEKLDKKEKKERKAAKSESEEELTRYDHIYHKTKIPALILTVVVFLGLLTGFFSLVIPNLYESLKQLVQDIPDYIKQVQDLVNKIFAKSDKLSGSLSSQISYIEDNVMSIFTTKIMPNMDTIVLKISNGVVVGVKAIMNILVGVIVMIYLLASKETLIAQGKKIIYCLFSKKHGNNIMSGLAYANSVFGGFINGKILDSLIIGIICFVFTNTLKMKYAILISLIVGVTNIIPFFGPFIGAIPGAILALMDDPVMFVIFIVFVIVLQQFDGNILGPLILGDSTGLSGMWVLFAILIGGDLFGVAGMILGVPVFACIYSLCAILLRDSLRAKHLSSRTEDYYRLIGFDEKTGEPLYRDRHEERFTARQRKRRKRKSDRENKMISEMLHDEKVLKEAEKEAEEVEEVEEK